MIIENVYIFDIDSIWQVVMEIVRHIFIYTTRKQIKFHD